MLGAVGGVGLDVESLVCVGEVVFEAGYVVAGQPRAFAAKDLLGLVYVREEIVDELLGMGGGVFVWVGVLLGAVFVGGFVSAVGGSLAAFEPELGAAPHGGKCFFEVLLVACVAVVLP